MKNRISIAELDNHRHRQYIYVAHNEEERELYEQMHMPGSLFIDVKTDLTGTKETGSGRNPLPDMHAFAQKMMEKGISADTPILLYTEGYNIGLFRAWYMLKFIGVQDVVVLYAPKSEWMKDRVVSGIEIPIDEMGTGLSFDEDRVRTQEDVKERMGQETLIDARDRARFAGYESDDKENTGHIPGALNFPYQDTLWDEDLDADKIKEYFGDLGAKPITVYCGSGMTAGYDLLLLDEIGIDANLYAGSFSDWVSNPGNEIEQVK